MRAHAYEVYGWSSFANMGPMYGQATTSYIECVCVKVTLKLTFVKIYLRAPDQCFKSSTYKFKRAFFRHDRRTAPKFGMHVWIQTRLALTKNKIDQLHPRGV